MYAQFPHGDVTPKITSEASTRALATWVAPTKIPRTLPFRPFAKAKYDTIPLQLQPPLCVAFALFAWLFAYALPSRSLSQLVPPSSEYSGTCLPFSSTAGQSIGDRHRTAGDVVGPLRLGAFEKPPLPLPLPSPRIRTFLLFPSFPSRVLFRGMMIDRPLSPALSIYSVLPHAT